MARTSRVRSISDSSDPQVREHPAHIEDWWDEPDESVQQTHKDIAALQGAWTVVSGRRSARFLVCGTRFAVHFADGDIYFGSLSLKPYALPKAMDVRIDEGPNKHKGQKALCIYELNGNTLRWCIAGPGDTLRPDAFTSEEDPRFLYLIFHRDIARGPA